MTPGDTTAPPLLAPVADCAPAPVWLRILALLLDGMLATIAGMLIFFRLVAPQVYPNSEEILQRQLQVIEQGSIPDPESDPEFADFLLTELKTLFLVFLFYFAVSEFAWRGATLGKRVFGLRAARWPLGEPPNWVESLARCIFKSASLLNHWMLLANFVPMLFRPTRRCLHDYIARTIVTGDAAPHVETSPLSGDDDE